MRGEGEDVPFNNVSTYLICALENGFNVRYQVFFDEHDATNDKDDQGRPSVHGCDRFLTVGHPFITIQLELGEWRENC